jgi:N-acetylmuramoyl-L-alanine amidase
MAEPGDAARTEDPAGRQRYAEGIAAGVLRTLGR